MTPDEYINNAVRTKSDKFYEPFRTNAVAMGGQHDIGNISVDVLHSLVGISTEAGELLDVAKKAMFYGKTVDYVNLDEEMGDVLWYVAIYCKARGVTIEDLMERNIAKLRVRFPHCFTEEQAKTRDLDAERVALMRQDQATDEALIREAADAAEIHKRLGALVGKPMDLAEAQDIIRAYYNERYGKAQQVVPNEIRQQSSFWGGLGEK